MRVKMWCESIEFLQSKRSYIQTIQELVHLVFFFLSHSNSSRMNNPLVSLSLFFFICDDQIVRTLHTVMSKVIIVDIQPQFKVGHVNVNRFTRVTTVFEHDGPRFNSFPRVGGPFVIIEGSRVSILPFSLLENMINALAIGKYHSKKGNDHGLWLLVDAVFY